MWRQRLMGAWALLLGSMSAGCHSPPTAQFPTVEAALVRLGEQTSCSRAIQGDASLTVSAPLFKRTGQLLYKAEAPERVRFDLYSSFGVTLSTLTSDGTDFALFNLDEKSFFYGPAKTCNLKRFTQVAIPPFALVELLRGRAPVLEHQPEGARIKFKSRLFSRGRYVVDVQGEHEASQRLEMAIPVEDWHKPLAEQRLRLLSVRVKQAGDLLYEAELSEHYSVSRAPSKLTVEEQEMGIALLVASGPECSAEVPRKIEFSVPGSSATLTIENHEVFHNPGKVPGAFTQEVPQGVRTQFTNCSD